MIQECQLDRGLSRRQRVTRSAVFKNVFSRSRRYRGRLLTLLLATSPDSQLRVGVTASKRIGNAPKRARAKRLLREAWRLQRFRFCAGYDVILVANRAILGAKRQDVETELVELINKAGMLAEQS